MSDNYNETDDYEDDEPTPAEDFKNLRAKAKKADKYEAEANQLRRELAFTKAGIDLSDQRMSYFVKGYDGELSADQIREAAISAGFLAAPEPVVDEAAIAAQAGQAAVQAVASGADAEFNIDSVAYQMQQALAEGGLEGMSAVAEQYGITFNSPTL